MDRHADPHTLDRTTNRTGGRVWRWALLGLLLCHLPGLTACDTTDLGVLEVVGPRDTSDSRGPYAVAVYTRGPVASARLVGTYGPDDTRRVAMDALGSGRFLGRLPGAPAGTEITYAVVLTSYAEETLTAEGEAFRILPGVVPTCLVDGDCDSSALICDRLRGRCVSPPATCRDDGDCGQDYFCPEPGTACRFRPLICTPEGACPQGYLCTDGRCVTAPPCTGDAECAQGQTCLVPPGRCVGDAECSVDAQCPAERPRCNVGRCEADGSQCGAERGCDPGQICEAGICVAERECSPGRPCPLGQECVGGGRCLPNGGCRGNDDCVRGQICQPDGRCVVPTCAGPDDCERGQRCNDGRCVDGCSGAQDCGRGEQCIAGACVLPMGCQADRDCGAGGRCHPLTQQCVACFADGQCPGGRCDEASGTCVPGLRSEICAACDAENPCNGGPEGLALICAADAGLPLCLPRCDRGQGCPQGYFCDGQYCQGEQFCQGSMCRNDADCDPLATCEQGLCLPRQPCRERADCPAENECSQGVCRRTEPRCTEPEECPPGTGCFLGRCVAAELGTGCQPCETISDCDGPGYCIDAIGDGQPRCITACGGAGCQAGAFCAPVGPGIALCVADSCDVAPACGRDDFEPNESFAAATQIEAGFVQVFAVACNRDVDVYRVAGLSGSVDVLAGRGDLAVEIWGRDQQLIDRFAVGPFEGRSIEIGPRTGFIFVRGAGGDTDYQIAGELRAAACMDDALEDNDTPERGTPIGNGADIQGRLCGADIDYFRLRVPNRGSFGLELTPGNGAVVDVRLLTNAGELVEQLQTESPVDLDLRRYPDNARIFSVQCARCADGGGSYRLRLR